MHYTPGKFCKIVSEKYREKTMKKLKPPVFNLDAEEQALSDAIDRDEFKSVENLECEKKKIREAAANYLKKEAKINIRLSTSDLDRIKELAAHTPRKSFCGFFHPILRRYFHVLQSKNLEIQGVFLRFFSRLRPVICPSGRCATKFCSRRIFQSEHKNTL